ncbi:hypothetical protein INT80_05415 [Gallibacterium anatis]|uniref:Uncharacterized protein n=1 Tax=Gallibacterium anatis TaxID=750 RepID=A0A930UTM6_9PAST|nr:hypothetical protein [Gallibacterium anatis]
MLRGAFGRVRRKISCATKTARQRMPAYRTVHIRRFETPAPQNHRVTEI